MYPNEIENRITAQSHLKGGVAPSRHALARHSYIERQKEWAREDAFETKATGLKTIFSSIAGRVIDLFTRIAMFPSSGRRATR